jgi:hypothetical protein
MGVKAIGNRQQATGEVRGQKSEVRKEQAGQKNHG